MNRISFDRRFAAIAMTACLGLALAEVAVTIDLRDPGRKDSTTLLDPETSTSSNLVQNVGGTFIQGHRAHRLLPDQQVGVDQWRLQELRCRRRNQPGSNCRPSL